MKPKKISNSLWNWKDIFIVQFIAIISKGLANTCQSLLVPKDHFLFPMYLALIYFVGHVLFLALLAFWIINLYDLSFSYFGLTIKNLKAGLKLSIKILIPFVLLLIFIINYPFTKTGQYSLFTPMINVTGPESLAVSFFYLILLSLFFLLPSLATELLYRGFVSIYMQEKWGRIFGGVINSIYFAVLMAPFQLPWLAFFMVMGIILFHSYHSRQNLWTGVIYLSFVRAALVLYVFGIAFFID